MPGGVREAPPERRSRGSEERVTGRLWTWGARGGYIVRDELRPTSELQIEQQGRNYGALRPLDTINGLFVCT